MPDCFTSIRRGALSADLFQFAGIQPIPAAVGTLIDLDSSLGAEVVTMKFYAGTPRALALTRAVYYHVLVALDMQQRFAGGFIFLIDPFQFEGVEPDAAATALADIDFQTADLYLPYIIET